MQTTLVIIKPDAIQRALIGRIIERFEDKGLQIIGAKMMLIHEELAEKHYADHKGKAFYDGLLEFMTSSPVMVLAVYGRQAIDVVRRMMGSTAGYKAEPGTIRGDFGSSQSFNLIHGSDSPEAAEKELNLFFREDELCPYDRILDQWVVDHSAGKPQ